MKKRILSVLLVITMLTLMVACAKTNETNGGAVSDTENNEVVSTTPSDTVTPENDVVVPEPDGETENNEVISDTGNEVADEAVHEHEYAEEIVVAATCTESGTVSYTCECGDTYSEEIEPTGHDWGEYASNGDATYFADGTKTAVCASCGETDTVPDDGSKLAYTYTDCEAVKYAQQTVNVRDLPTTDGNKVGSLSTNDEVTVTGTCNETGWYRIVYGDGVAYVSNKYLGDSKVEISANSGNSGNSGGSGNSLANHFGITIPCTATYYSANTSYGITWGNIWNSNTTFDPNSNFVGHVENGTQVTISNLSGSKNNCMAYITLPNGTSGWTTFSYNGYNHFTW